MIGLLHNPVDGCCAQQTKIRQHHSPTVLYRQYFDVFPIFFRFFSKKVDIIKKIEYHNYNSRVFTEPFHP